METTTVYEVSRVVLGKAFSQVFTTADAAAKCAAKCEGSVRIRHMSTKTGRLLPEVK